MIDVIEFFSSDNKQHWIDEMSKCDWCDSMATIMGKEKIYVSTDHVGLYEKYGYEFMGIQKCIHGEDSRVYFKKLQRKERLLTET